MPVTTAVEEEEAVSVPDDMTAGLHRMIIMEEDRHEEEEDPTLIREEDHLEIRVLLLETEEIRDHRHETEILTRWGHHEIATRDLSREEPCHGALKPPRH